MRFGFFRRDVLPLLIQVAALRSDLRSTVTRLNAERSRRGTIEKELDEARQKKEKQDDKADKVDYTTVGTQLSSSPSCVVHRRASGSRSAKERQLGRRQHPPCTWCRCQGSGRDCCARSCTSARGSDLPSRPRLHHHVGHRLWMDLNVFRLPLVCRIHLRWYANRPERPRHRQARCLHREFGPGWRHIEIGRAHV